MTIKEAMQRAMNIFVNSLSVVTSILICYLCVLAGLFLFIVVSASLCYPIYLLGDALGILK